MQFVQDVISLSALLSNRTLSFCKYLNLHYTINYIFETKRRTKTFFICQLKNYFEGFVSKMYEDHCLNPFSLPTEIHWEMAIPLG